MKNLMDFCIGTPCFWLFGFGLMFGTGTAWFGLVDPFILGDYSRVLPAGVPLWAFAIFQTVFCATAATIVSGAMAERTKFSAYCIYSAAIFLLIYPISGHWIWGGGWLSQLGFHDFAGSTYVHMVGGVCALIGAKILGPRLGKYDKNGKPRAILGHNLTFAALGVFILWFCWFGFNGASTVGLDISEHGLLTAYSGFASLPEELEFGGNVVSVVPGVVPAAEAISVKKVLSFDDASQPTFTKIEIVCKEEKLYPLKAAMCDIGITGMTVSHVMGYGAQKGKTEYYRGLEVEANLLPKVQVDIVVSKVPVRSVIETAKCVLYTGHIGDGKIFVYDVENVVKVRTGEEGFAALQDVE